MKNTKYLVANAAIAAIYAVLTLMIAPIAYGEIQFRISEVIVFLAFYNKKYFPGLIVGCALANLASPMMAYDMVFGVGATVLACIGMYLSKELWQGALCGSIANGILVGIELSLAFKIPFLINAFYVFIGELAVLIIGMILFKQLEKNSKFMELITE